MVDGSRPYLRRERPRIRHETRVPSSMMFFGVGPSPLRAHRNTHSVWTADPGTRYLETTASMSSSSRPWYFDMSQSTLGTLAGSYRA